VREKPQRATTREDRKNKAGRRRDRKKRSDANLYGFENIIFNNDSSKEPLLKVIFSNGFLWKPLLNAFATV
jgi:hypothetical protein